MQSVFDINSYISQSLIDNDNNLDIFEELEKYFGPNKISAPIPKVVSIQSYINTCEVLDSSNESPINIHIKDIQTILNFPKNKLLVFYNSEPKRYKRPDTNTIDVFHIWKNANIPKVASIQDIEILLLDWAHTYASLEIDEKDKKITKITWHLLNKTICISTWSAFIKWIICASIPK
jgi:hypothetical protein